MCASSPQLIVNLALIGRFTMQYVWRGSLGGCSSAPPCPLHDTRAVRRLFEALVAGRGGGGGKGSEMKSRNHQRSIYFGWQGRAFHLTETVLIINDVVAAGVVSAQPLPSAGAIGVLAGSPTPADDHQTPPMSPYTNVSIAANSAARLGACTLAERALYRGR